MKFLIFLMAFFSMILAFIHICKRMGIDVIGILNRLGNKPTIEYREDREPIDHGPGLDYIFPPPPPVPEWVKEAEEAEQGELPFP